MPDPTSPVLLRQYTEIKDRYPDTILLFRLGDFLECYLEDAELVGKVLDLVVTTRKMKDADVRMTGIPFHNAEPYITKLIGAGHKCAICEQVGQVQTNTKLPAPPEKTAIAPREPKVSRKQAIAAAPKSERVEPDPSYNDYAQKVFDGLFAE